MPEASRTALIVIDMLNSYDHDDAEPLTRSVRAALPALGRLIERAREGDNLIVYVNDNHGDWGSGPQDLLESALSTTFRDLIEPIAPERGTAFIAKARHSIFYETQLEYLLRDEQIERVVLAGQVTEQCVLYSALDAHIRHLHVAVPRDAVAAIHPDLAEAALRMMEINMDAEIADADEIALDG